MYVIERGGKLYGPYESYQAAAIASGIGYQGPHSNMMGGPASDIREVHAHLTTQRNQMDWNQSDPETQEWFAREQARNK